MFDTLLRSGDVDSVRDGNSPPRGGDINTGSMRCLLRVHTPERLRVHEFILAVQAGQIQRPALQAAGYNMFTTANSGTGPWVWSSLSLPPQRESVSDANEKSSYITLSYDTKLKSITVNDTTKTCELPGR